MKICFSLWFIPTIIFHLSRKFASHLIFICNSIRMHHFYRSNPNHFDLAFLCEKLVRVKLRAQCTQCTIKWKRRLVNNCLSMFFFLLLFFRIELLCIYAVFLSLVSPFNSISIQQIFAFTWIEIHCRLMSAVSSLLLLLLSLLLLPQFNVIAIHSMKRCEAY